MAFFPLDLTSFILSSQLSLLDFSCSFISYLRQWNDIMFLGLSVCLSARLLKKLRMDFDEIFK